tara:strand:+ start:1572 stop:3308 length:1737 start_codon:yes stop_codon:yes gene_type:complete
MTSTNPPPGGTGETGGTTSRVTQAVVQQTQQAIITSQMELEKATRQLNLSITQAGRQLVNRFTGFINPVVRLEDSIRRMDETNRRALQMGTTTKKLSENIAKNTTVLERGRVSTQKLLNTFTEFFEQGVRDQGGAIGALTEEMIATGQNTTGLGKQLSDLTLFTGGNSDALKMVSKTNIDVSDKYGISNEKLIESLNTLRDEFRKASFFGAETAASFEVVAQQLKGRAGGTDIEGGLRALFQILTPGQDSLRSGVLLGAMSQRERVGAGGQITLGDARAVLGRVEDIYNEFQGLNAEARLRAAAARAGRSESEFVQLLNLKKIADQDFSIQEGMKKTSQDTFGSLKNIEERSLNFFDYIAPSLLALMATTAGGISTLVNLSMVGGVGGGFMPLPGPTGKRRSFGAAVRGQAGRLNRIGMSGGYLAAGGFIGESVGDSIGGDTGKAIAAGGRIATYAGFGAMAGNLIPIPGVGQGIGALAGGIIGGIMEIVDHTKGTEEELAKQRANEERKDRERAAARSQEASQMQFTAEYIRRSTREAQVSDPKVQQMLVDNLREIRKMNNLLAARGNKGTLPIGDQ